MTSMQSKYRGYCNRCHYTVWKGEWIRYNGNAWHTDCITALRDKTPRKMDPKYGSILGEVDKRRFIRLLSNQK